MKFVHLNVKSEYSILNSIAKVNDIIHAASQFEMPYVALTDINNMHIVYTFEKKCHTSDVKDIQKMQRYEEVHNIIGVCFCVNYGTSLGMITLLAKNSIGYKNLVKLSTVANSKHDKAYEFPYIDFADIKTHNSGLICLTGGIDGVLFEYIIANQFTEAKQHLLSLVDIFSKENVYIEFMNHFIETEETFLRSTELKNIIDEMNLKVVATNNVYYMKREHAYHRALGVEMNPNPEGINIYSRFVDYNDEFYFKTEDEMEQTFQDYFSIYPDLFANTLTIAEECSHVRVPKEQALPEFPLPKGYTNESYLEHLMWEGFDVRYGHVTDKDELESLKNRLVYEYKTICSMGFVDYHLIVADFIQWAKDSKVYEHPERYFPHEYFPDYSLLPSFTYKKDFSILVGPGRGSAAGSMLCYCLKITNIDPIPNGLLFERFLNPERVSMPDIDIDFPNEFRYLIVEFVQNKYGFEKVSQIVTFQTLGPKSIIKSIGKALGVPYYETNEMTKNIPLEIKVSKENNDGEIVEKMVPVEFLSQIEHLDYFKMKIATNEAIKELFVLGKILDGLPSSTGKHAAGVIIGCQALENYLPLMEVDGVMVTQFEKGDSESIGLLKMDFLGLQTLDVFKEAIDLIEINHGDIINLDEIPADDALTYETIFQTGNTGKIFQFESSGMKNLLKKMKPNSLKDLTAANAAYRPGPMEFIPEYLDNRLHADKINYPSEAYKEVAEETFGILLYQEQIMEIVQKMAGFTLGEADVLRRGISKKIAKYLAEGKTNFINGCLKLKTCDKETAAHIYEIIEKFVDYGFNKSHSTAYGQIAYQEGYLKAHYPECFMAANLTICSQDAKKLGYCLAETKRMGITILPPDVRASQEKFLIEDFDGEKCIRFSLSAIKSVGETNAKALSSVTDLTVLQNYLNGLSKGNLRANQIVNLIHSGAFDYLGVRKVMVAELPKMIQLSKLTHNLVNYQSPNLLSYLPTTIKFKGYEYQSLEKLKLEKDCIQIALSGHPVEAVRNLAKVTNTIADIAPLNNEDSSFDYYLDGMEVEILGVIDACKTIITRKGRSMAFLNIEDEFSEVESILFPDTYKNYEESLDELMNIPLKIKGVVQYAFDENGDVKTSLLISSLTKVIKETYKLYIEKSSITQDCLDDLSSYNGVAEVILVDTDTNVIKKLPFTIDLNKNVANQLRNNAIEYTVKK